MSMSQDAQPTPETSPTRRHFRWRWLLLIVGAMIVVWLGRSSYRYKMIGPSATEAFQWYIKDPIPNSVTDLKLKYSPHMKGYWIWLSFRVDPGELDTLFDFQKLHPRESYLSDENGVPFLPQPLETFRIIDPEGFDEMKKGELFYFDGDDRRLSRVVVVSKDRRKVYYYRFQD
ncbi:MAG: hypothetical protein K8T91_12405 [Planctomycetes bacterium]|nr:hypothetical protein [Planctomycetota bacterium]